MIVIPVVNCPEGDFEGVERHVRKAEEFSEWIHLDVADGKFTFHKTFRDPERWIMLQTPLKLEVHLMVEEPEKIVEVWLRAGARRVIVHIESLVEEAYRSYGYTLGDALEHLRDACARHGAELMISSNPETSVEKLAPFFAITEQYQMLAVHPGPAGQHFLPITLEKIRALRKALPHATIEVDGGMSEETARLVREAGADIIASEHYIFSNGKPKEAYARLVAAANA